MVTDISSDRKCNTIHYNISKWGELSSESGASCLRARFPWGELSLGWVVLFPLLHSFKCFCPFCIVFSLLYNNKHMATIRALSHPFTCIDLWLICAPQSTTVVISRRSEKCRKAVKHQHNNNMSRRSVNLTTLFMDMQPVLSAHESSVGENDYRKDFITYLHARMMPDVRIEPTTVRIPGGRASDRVTAPNS